MAETKETILDKEGGLMATAERIKARDRLVDEAEVPRVGRLAQAVYDELKRAYIFSLLYEVDYGPHTAFVSDGWVPSTVLAEIGGMRFSARLYDLKQDRGVKWEKRRLEVAGRATPIWLYRLVEADE